MAAHEQQLKVAVVGGGIGGIAAAHYLAPHHEVTLFERNPAIGGHTCTIMVDDPGGPLPVDIGFIVCNERTYPRFYKLLAEWGVERRDSDMSFGFSCAATGLGYVGPSASEFLRKPSNLLNLRLIRMLLEQRRFGRRARADLESGALADIALGTYLERVGVSPFFVDTYLIPIAASVWSSPDRDMLAFPALTFIRFFENHGLLDLSERPMWQTIVGGSHSYLRAFEHHFKGRVETGASVESVSRSETGVTLHIAGRAPQGFDRVVMATHADVTLALLADASDEERDALSSWTYHQNLVQLHTDAGVMPDDRRLWASWNYRRRADATAGDPVAITYSMNRLQGLPTDVDYLVTLNGGDHVDPSKVIHEVEFAHPGYSVESIRAQEQLRSLNGTRGTYYCGAHMRYGFHEDGVASAADVAASMGIAP